MKITCSYCGNKFNDTLEKCPSCGAANEGVVRTAEKQPVTIEQLKEWYSSKGLPPYDVTRFFIGENYTKPKAFGIYKDENTGNFVVYKNKASGERAIRYEGTDEAYAVNELFQRLKQEIIQQKANNVKKTGSVQGQRSPSSHGIGCLPVAIITAVIMMVVFIAYFGFIEPKTIPAAGYYTVDNASFYHITADSRDYWYKYNAADGSWTETDMFALYPDIYEKRKTANSYLTAEEWSSALPCSDFKQTVQYSDYINNYKVNTGYYAYDDYTYYHLYEDQDSGWYCYDYYGNSWDPVNYDSVPEDLKHNSLAEDFYFTPVWDTSTQFSDFEDTAYYSDYLEEQEHSSWNDDDSSDYDWDSNDSWDGGGMDWDSDW